MRTTRIEGISYYLPKHVTSNESLAQIYEGWTAEKIAAKVGIDGRHIAAADECASDLAYAAAERLFTDHAIERSRVDFLLFCTQSPDFFLPTSACILQHRLGLSKHCGALDFNLGCSGFVYGLGLAKGLIETQQANGVLLLAAETYSKFIHPGDKSVRTLFGDAGSATFLSLHESENRCGVLSLACGTDGSGAHALIVPTGGMRAPHVEGAPVTTDASGNVRTVNDLYMDGGEIFAFTLREVPPLLDSLLAREGLTRNDVDLYVFHQANSFMLEHLRRKLQIPADRFVVDMQDCGNTVSSTIPIALARAINAGRVRPGMRVALVGFGVGLSWAGALVLWG